MIKKDSIRHKKAENENKVEDIYGVHFKYEDLFTRLLKVQKERQLSEENIQIPRLVSIDTKQHRQNSFNTKKKPLKKQASNNIIFQTTNDRSSSVNKTTTKQALSSRRIKPIITKSPELKKPKKKASHLKTISKLTKKLGKPVNSMKKQ